MSNTAVEKLLKKHKTNISTVLRVIEHLQSGRYIPAAWDGAVDAVMDNQDNGTGSWHVFIDYAANQ